MSTDPPLRAPDARTKIAEIIARHGGRAAAISIAQIAAVTGLSPRIIKQHVHDLRLLGMRIGSCRVADGDAVAGYYLVQTRGELVESLRPYQRQIVTELRLVRSLLGRPLPAAVELEGQLALELGESRQ